MEQLLSPENLLSVSAVAALTLLLTNLFKNQIGVPPRWLALAIAPTLMVLATFAVAASKGTAVTWQDVMMAVLNGCIAAYSISATANAVAVRVTEKGARTASNTNAFFTPWF